MYLEDTTFRTSSSMDPVVPYGYINSIRPFGTNKLLQSGRCYIWADF
jgi:hypothetical protein